MVTPQSRAEFRSLFIIGLLFGADVSYRENGEIGVFVTISCFRRGGVNASRGYLLRVVGMHRPRAILLCQMLLVLLKPSKVGMRFKRQARFQGDGTSKSSSLRT